MSDESFLVTFIGVSTYIGVALSYMCHMYEKQNQWDSNEKYDWELSLAKAIFWPLGFIKGFLKGSLKYFKMYKPTKEIRKNFMTKPAIVTGVVLIVIAVIIMWFSGNYNSLVGSKAQVDKSWAGVEVQYQKRMDSIDNLVETVKGSQKQEIAVFGEIARARSNYNNASNSADKVAASNQIETNIALIPRLQEAYPELKSNQNVQMLMGDLKSTENDIAGARNKYNDTASNYNLNVRSFPKNIFAGMFGFQPQPLFKSQSGAENGVKVKF